MAFLAGMAARVIASGAVKKVAAGAVKGVVKGAKSPVARNLAMNAMSGGRRNQSLLNGTNYEPTRGFTTVPLPTRTQAQSATWGQTGQMGNTQYSGFGQMQLNRGFRGISQPGGGGQVTDDIPASASSLPPSGRVQATMGGRGPVAPAGVGPGAFPGSIPTTAREVPNRTSHFQAGAGMPVVTSAIKAPKIKPIIGI